MHNYSEFPGIMFDNILAGMGGKDNIVGKTKGFKLVLLICILASILLSTACTRIGGSADPADWGYTCVVTYNALGGSINTREVRQTYYRPNSLVFEPSGTTNMLIKPIKDGYILAGWYTAKKEIFNDKNEVIGYDFLPENRWDFDEDRVTDSLTLYARWIEQAKVDYLHASSGEVLFSKNVTTDSPVQILSSAAEQLVTPAGFTLYGYYADEACTRLFDFDVIPQGSLVSLIPANAVLYTQLAQEFPEYIQPFVKPEPSGEDDGKPQEVDLDYYLKQIGFDIVTDDPAARAQIRARKNVLIETSIQDYMAQYSRKTIYLKFIEGRYIRVDDRDDLKKASLYGFRDKDTTGAAVDGYIIANDIDFAGVTMEPVESFSGDIFGNGYTLRNIQMIFSNRKLDIDPEKKAGLFLSLDGALIQDLTFENLTLTLNYKPGIPVTVGALAVQADGSKLQNITFSHLRITTGNSDDGTVLYVVSDLIAKSVNCQLINVKGDDVEITASRHAIIRAALSPVIIIRPDPS
jgi:hypothetical protein